MYPTIYDLVSDLFGLNIGLLKMIQSFGFFVAIAFLLASYFFSKELKRKEQEGLLQSETIRVLKGAKASMSELVSSGIIGFIIGYKVVFIALNYGDFIQNTQGFILSLQGNLLGGIIAGGLFAYMKFKEKDKEKREKPELVNETIHPYQHVGNMTLIAAVAGLTGAKIFHNLENLDDFMRDPVGSLLSFSGLTMYGGLIFGAVSVVYYARKHGLRTAPLIDACAPSLMLAYGVGRIGCQVAGDGDWGIDNLMPKPGWMSFLPDWFWSYSYPHNVNSVGIPIPGCIGAEHCNMLANPVFPTPLYEVVMSLLLFVVLWTIRKKIKMPGVLFSIYLVMNGVERFFIEKIRINTFYHVFGHGITQAEIISVVLFVLGIAGIFYFRKKEHEVSLK